MPMNPCRLCGAGLLARPVIALEGMPKAAQHFPLESEFAGDRGITLTIRQCGSCGLVQLDGEPVDYYRDVITAATLSPKSRASRLAQMREFAERFGLAGRSVLDVGTGKGEMLDVLAEAGLKATGLEASAESVAVGRAAGRVMARGHIEDEAPVAGAPFDAFISLNFLEHVPRPGAALRRLHALTGSEAAGLVTVPNLDYLLATKSYYEFVADHLSYFTQKTLAHAFESSGFDVVACRTINEDNDVLALVKKRRPLDVAGQFGSVEALAAELRRIVSQRRALGKRVAVWGAGHRTLALLSLAGLKDVAYVVDSAKFKQGRFTPVLHTPIVGPEHLAKEPVDLVIIMVPGLYPGEVLKTLRAMRVCSEIAMLRGETVEFVEAAPAEAP